MKARSLSVHLLLLGALFPWLIGALTACGPGQSGDQHSENTTSDMQKSPLDIIRDPAATEADLVRAIRDISDEDTSPGFWNAIANDARFTGTHRRHVVLQLFKRHCSTPMTLDGFLERFARQAWWAGSRLEMVKHLAGKVPVKVDLERSIYHLEVLPTTEAKTCHVYFSIMPLLEIEVFERMRAGAEVPEQPGAFQVVEVGYGGDLLAGHNQPW